MRKALETLETPMKIHLKDVSSLNTYSYHLVVLTVLDTLLDVCDVVTVVPVAVSEVAVLLAVLLRLVEELYVEVTEVAVVV